MLIHKIKLSFRNHLRQFRTTILNILGLSVGMAMFIVLVLYFLNEYTYDEYNHNIDNIYRVYERYSGEENVQPNVAMPIPNVLINDFEEVDKVVSFWGSRAEIIRPNKEKINAAFYSVEPEVFEMFDFQLLQGDVSTALNDPKSVVVTEDFAHKLFGDSMAIGKSINIDKFSFIVTGILEDLPKNSMFSFDMLISTHVRTKVFPDWEQRWWHGGVNTFFIPKNKELLPDIDKKLAGIPDKYYPNWLNKDVTYFARPMKKSHLYNDVIADMKPTVSTTYLYILITIALSILLIACINYVNLATVQSLSKNKIAAINKVHGAKTFSLLTQQIWDSVIITIISLGFALIITEQLLPIFTKLTGVQLQYDFKDFWVLAGLFGFSICIGILSGLYPGIKLSAVKGYQASSGNLLKQDRKVFFQRGSITLQYVITIILIISIFGIIKQSSFMLNHDVGFNRRNLLAIFVGQSDNYLVKYDEAKLFRDEVQKYSSRFNYSIGTITENVPGFYFQNSFKVIPEGFDKADGIRMTSTAVDENFINVYSVKMTEGRFFSNEYPTDRTAFIINETAMRMFGWESADGKLIQLEHEGENFPVVGVMNDIIMSSLHEENGPVLYRFGQHNNFPAFITFRLDEDRRAETIKFLKKTWEGLFPDYTFSSFFVEDKYIEHYENEKILVKIVLVFSLIAITLSCLGLYSFMSYEIFKRTKEIGIRKTNGAKTREIMFLFSKDFTKWVAVAIVIACPVAYYFMNKWLQNFAYRTSLSWWIFASAGVIALLVALLTVSWQSWRAASRNPVESLRYE